MPKHNQWDNIFLSELIFDISSKNRKEKERFKPHLFWMLGEKKIHFCAESNREIIPAAQAGMGTNLNQGCIALMSSTGSN